MSPFSAESADALPGPDWLKAARRAAAERFGETDLPTSALEEWRYSRIDALELDRFRPAPAPGSDGRPPGDFTAQILSALEGDVTLIETTDGHLAGVRGSDPAVAVQPLAEVGVRPESFGAIAGEPDAFAALSGAFAPDPVVVKVAPGSVARPVVVVHWCTGDDAALFPRILVDNGEGAEARVLEIVAGPGRCLAVPVTELDVKAGGRLAYLHVQRLGDRAWQIALQASRVGQEATLLSAAVALGGDYARLRTASSVAGPGGSSRLLALYFGAGTQMHDFRTVQEHRAPKTRSDLLYKGVVANQARSVYSGLIRVEKGAAGTNAFQTNRNLVLHEGAHADSVPNLEIEDNDVRCSHASAVGPVSEDERFYLESRGVPPAITDRLISLGFLSEVIEQLPFAALGRPLAAELAAKLAGAEAAELERAASGGRP